MDGVGFYTAIAALTVEMPEITLSAIVTQKLMEPFTKEWEQGNVDEMWQKYYNESFKLGHRVLLVSHSQGNLFANRIFDTINPTEYKIYFANLQVASPANKVKADKVGKGAYVTLWGDPVINPIPGSMSGNAHGSPGHAFVAAYLDQEDPHNKIVYRIKILLPTLDAELSQWNTNEEFDRGTCDYRITVKHRFDSSVQMSEKVYPFAPNKKLYPVQGEWVKATCGGQNILGKDHKVTTWEGKRDDECYMIDNPPHEKITNASGKFLPGHNHSNFLPQGLEPPVGTIDDSTGCATIHVPEGYLTFYRLKGSQGRADCVPDYQFGYREGQIYTCLPAGYFEMIGLIRISDFLRQAKYNGIINICGGSNSSWSRK